MRTTFSQTRTTLKKTAVVAAKKAKLSIDTTRMSSAFSEEAVILNYPIKGIELVSDAELEEGVDMFFVYLGFPGDVRERFPKFKLTSGYYLIRVSLEQKNQKGNATLLTTSRKEVATLSMDVERAPAHDRAAFPAGVKLSGHINWCGAAVDILVRKILITISVKWC